MNARILTHRLALASVASFLSLSAFADTYTWYEGATAPWNSTLSWNPMGIPTAGDSAVFPGVCTAEISGTCTAGYMDLWNLHFNGMGPDSVFAVDSGDGSPSEIHFRQGSVIGVADNDPNLTLHLANPVSIWMYPGENDGGSNPANHVLAKISGGTEEAPCNITLRRPNKGWTSARHIIRNANNDFRGDWILDGNNSATQLIIGYRELHAENSMLGHPDNVVYLLPGGTLAWHLGGTNPLNRKVYGCGTVHGTNFDSWGSFLGSDFTLGPNFEAHPETATSQFSTLTIRNDYDYYKNSGTLRMDPDTTFVFDMSATQADKIQLITYNSFEFSGKIVINETEPIPVGTTYTLFTVPYKVQSVTWNPSSTPEGYSFKVVGNATDGWTISTTKLREGANVTTLPTFDIGETYATSHAEITTIVPAGDVTLRVYYGTTDGGTDPSAWEHVVTYPDTELALEQYEIPLTGLTVDTTYFVRHSAENISGENFAAESGSFTTQAWETPDIFTWVATNEAWSLEDAWSKDSRYARHVPGFAGDTIRIVLGGKNWDSTDGVARTVVLDADYRVGQVKLHEGAKVSASFVAPDAPATLYFDMGYPEGTNVVHSDGQLPSFIMGAPENDSLSIHLEQALHFLRTSSHGTSFNIWVPISGGTPEVPTPIWVEARDSEWVTLNFTLFNPSNSWVGDLTVGALYAQDSRQNLRIGNGAFPSENGMMGDPSNAVVLANRGTLFFYAPSGTAFDLERTVRGYGTVYGVIHNDESRGALHFTDSARLEPQHWTGTGYGSIAVRAAELTFDEGATIALDVSKADPTQSDNIVLECTSDLDLKGRIELMPDEPHVTTGTTWTIGTVTKAASLSLSGLVSPGYRVYAEEDVDAEVPTWILKATKLPEGTILFLR